MGIYGFFYGKINQEGSHSDKIVGHPPFEIFDVLVDEFTLSSTIRNPIDHCDLQH